MKSLNSKVGIILASHTREPSNFSIELVKKGIELLKEENIVVYFSGTALTNDSEIRREILEIKKLDPDLFIVIPGNWIEPPSLCHPLEEIKDENIVLWGFPESLELISKGHFLGSNSAFTVLRNAMEQMSFRFISIQKFPNDKTAIKKIVEIAKVNSVIKYIRRMKLGLIGYCSMGIYTACFDQLKIRKYFGVEIDTSSDSYLLFRRMEEISKDEVDIMIRSLSKRCKIDPIIIKDKSLEKSIRMYLALEKMIKEGNWSGLSVKCQHEFSTYLKCTACLPLSLLTDEGIMCSDEGDIHALLTMIIMRNLSDPKNPIYFGDIYMLEEGGFLMDHCGLSPHSCADNNGITLLPQTSRISKDGKTTGGVISSYMFKAGKVTIGRIENDRKDSFKFHFTKGNVKPIESISYGWSSLVFTPEQNSGYFSDNQLANHYIFVYEDIIEKLRIFCEILGIKII